MSVKGLFEGLGAPAEAVSWAADYGDDLKRAWEECEHPELLIPMAAGAGVPNFDVINATIEVVREHLACVRVHPAVDSGMKTIERFICEEATDDEIVSVLSKMGLLTKDTEDQRVSFRSSCGSIAHLCEAALMGDRGLMGGLQSRLSTAVMLAAQARAETIFHGHPDSLKGKAIDEGLRGTAPIARRFLPYESFVGGFVAAMCVTGEDEEVGSA